MGRSDRVKDIDLLHQAKSDSLENERRCNSGNQGQTTVRGLEFEASCSIWRHRYEIRRASKHRAGTLASFGGSESQRSEEAAGKTCCHTVHTSTRGTRLSFHASVWKVRSSMVRGGVMIGSPAVMVQTVAVHSEWVVTRHKRFKMRWRRLANSSLAPASTRSICLLRRETQRGMH